MNMKKIIYSIIALVSVFAFSSCEDFFTREPNNEFSAETYFASESELQMYADGMLNSWMPAPDGSPFGGDAYNDIIASKTSTDFFRADVTWDDVKQDSWSWGFLRRCNYMLTNMVNAKGKVSDEVYNHYEGVAKFWRAYNYMSKVKTFSDVPWTDVYLQPTDTTILFGKRDDREFVFSKIVEDLEFARANVSGAAKFHTDSRNRIDKFVVNALASRFYLYEATFRMNVKNNPSTGQPWTNQYQTPEDLLKLAAEAAKVVIDEGGFKLSNDYAALFISPTLNKDEVIWGKTYISEINGRHETTRYYNSNTLGQQTSGTKELIRMYLKTDGTPVTTGEMTIFEEFEGRDSRLAATVLGPGHEITLLSGPGEQPMNFMFCKTGYQLIKWCIPDETHHQNSIDENSLPIVRYAEVLLNYAEAKNELGEMTTDIWNMTVGALRERAGVTNIYPTAADPWLENYYKEGLSHAPQLNPVALEIRRERVTELILESGLRQDDIYRYGQADLIVKRHNGKAWAGLWVSENDYKNGFQFAGKTYTLSTNANSETNYQLKETPGNTEWSVEKAGAGYYLLYNYELNWEDRMYCRPIPQSAKLLNPNLGENYGW